MKLHRVIAEVRRPRGDFPGQVEEGQYTFEDGVVTLVNNAGAPICDRYGKVYEKKLAPGEDPHVIAGRLTKEVWQARGGGKRKFSAPIITQNWESYDSTHSLGVSRYRIADL
jgi:hypothetical protein